MKQAILHPGRQLAALIIVALLLFSFACTPTTTTTPATPTPKVGPTLKITVPIEGTIVSAGDVKVSVEVSNFNLVEKRGQANVTSEGHIHYFMDVPAPTAAGKPAVTAPGTYAATAATSYTWPNPAPGTHTFSAEMVNNDHTPLSPPVVARVMITVAVPPPGRPTAAPPPSGQPTTINLSAASFAFDKKTLTVPSGARVTVVFENKDSAPHNLGIYQTSEATQVLFRGETIAGAKTTSYEFTAPATPGTYFFRCDIHPTRMVGELIVTAK